MDHKAYALDYAGFVRELKGPLEEALRKKDVRPLRKFLAANWEALRDPDEEEPLDEDWEQFLEDQDAHRYGDVALTKFYDQDVNVGLSTDWMDIDDLLLEHLGESGRAIALGDPCGPDDNHFDAGKMGSYFQAPEEVKANRKRLKALLRKEPDLEEDLEPLREMLEAAAKAGKGLYITF